jgi:4-hydroxybenzoate polyprenyltransferase
MLLRHILILIRPEHWVKNLFLFIPAFFSARLTEPMVFEHASIAFCAFCCIASAVYVLNDLVDAPHDRQHPLKKDRPIARGVMSAWQGVAVMTVLLGIGFGLTLLLNTETLILGLSYLVINVFYSFYLKHIALVDISLISLGFIIRIFMGGAATGIPISQWLIVLTFLLALILGLAKRRGEYIVASDGHSFRKALEGYNLPFLDVAMVVCSTVAIVAYLMYCFSPEVTGRIGSDKIFYTTFFVILGILRYLQLAMVYNRTESPTRALMRDHFLQIVLCCWIGAFAFLLYFRH